MSTLTKKILLATVSLVVALASAEVVLPVAIVLRIDRGQCPARACLRMVQQAEAELPPRGRQ